MMANCSSGGKGTIAVNESSILFFFCGANVVAKELVLPTVSYLDGAKTLHSSCTATNSSSPKKVLSQAIR